jgi:hypothetical protein
LGLTPPGFRAGWLVRVRNEKKEYVVSITGVPVTVLAEEEKIKKGEINFLCLHIDYCAYKLASSWSLRSLEE